MILLSIDNLSNEVNEQEIGRLFSSYGKVKSIKLILNAPHSRSAGSGFIEIESNDAKNIISALDGRVFNGKILQITEANNADKNIKKSSDNSMEPTQSATDTVENHRHPSFRVASVEKVTNPELGPEKDWYRYTLMSGKSRITGLHRGTIAEVTEYAVKSAQEYNLRNTFKGGRAFSWSSRNRK